jgi:hypothetical protein
VHEQNEKILRNYQIYGINGIFGEGKLTGLKIGVFEMMPSSFLNSVNLVIPLIPSKFLR